MYKMQDFIYAQEFKNVCNNTSVYCIVCTYVDSVQCAQHTSV